MQDLAGNAVEEVYSCSYSIIPMVSWNMGAKKKNMCCLQDMTIFFVRRHHSLVEFMSTRSCEGDHDARSML